LALAIGAKEKKYMKKKIKYTDGPKMDNARIVKDFLPPPEKLLFKKDLSYRSQKLKQNTLIPINQMPIQNHMKVYSSA